MSLFKSIISINQINKSKTTKINENINKNYFCDENKNSKWSPIIIYVGFYVGPAYI
ncbi:hypothetical protein DDB_G0290843 [Dictyostelium discoideum AX4]|uniref:Uncharacterized protein n=1 Tax=Dictyostelium discoideum TaxID=44689 RepID=Q54FI1_DICDI|nr:hypothetical protein DDB_G0290843 [Dictyostelium discoideum AX4]EAL62016.1 hypothetical protein DDB_G0290843 [Dictyostelium discoideum AX4]|eukprot:XP_635520.1 hypothetical protein DDB_G0290843 [Dictyostelium discoideum AX4]